MTTAYTVTGMTCAHCVHAVREELGKLPGVTSIEVDLVPGGETRVRVVGDRVVVLDDVRAAVEEAGYVLSGVVS